ncbi:MAG: exosortase family protein XrtF [Bergeyella cardium]|uniref:exosortase family protein XrtF n=1 Tax=Bergeyella cardium TaxID=1585976 RepID=UPI000EA336B4|nr:exosortase family protein XrtF [Bergeyella cardium]
MLKDFKPALFILIRFLGIYIVLVFVYQTYLNAYEGQITDPITRWIAEQPSFIQTQCGYKTTLVDSEQYSGTLFQIGNVYTSRMVEGCNAISVIILFLAFIFAFYKGGKTFVFAGVGVLILHLMNILRIAAINIVAIELSAEDFKIAHDYFFPAIIYGTVVVLWLVWIKFFVLKRDENH